MNFKIPKNSLSPVLQKWKTRNFEHTCKSSVKYGTIVHMECHFSNFSTTLHFFIMIETAFENFEFNSFYLNQTRVFILSPQLAITVHPRNT